MASCQTTQWVSSSPYVKLTVAENTSSSTATKAVLSWTLQYIASSAANASGARSFTVNIAGKLVSTGTYTIDGKTGTKTVASGTYEVTRGTAAKSVTFDVSFDFNLTWSGKYASKLTASGSIFVAAKTSYTVKYDANGGSGAPSSQIKWYGTNTTLSSTKPTRSGHTFKGWGTSSTSTTVSYEAGATYSSNASITLYAIWNATTYTVKYNANGGSGAPSNQTKTYGISLTLSGTKPTRSGYTFKGWGTSASSTTVSYVAGASYTKNAAITLYAVWEQTYTKPKITGLSVTRCDKNKNKTDEGTCALIEFSWSTSVEAAAIGLEYKLASSTSWADCEPVIYMLSGTSGVFSYVLERSFSVDYTYDIRITVTDVSGVSGNTSVIRNLPAVQFPIDMKVNGKGVSIGKPATKDNLFDVGWASRFDKDVIVGRSEEWNDGLPGTKLSYLGGLLIQRAKDMGGTNNPYIDFRLQGNTSTYDCRIMYYGDTKSLKFQGADEVYFEAKGQEFCPYFSKKDGTITVTWAGAGYLSSGKTKIYFSIPLSKPVIGNPTITVASANGFKLRQNNRYTHDSTDEIWITPSKYESVTLTPAGYLDIRVLLNAADTSAINNDAIGIQWSGTITFS